MHSSTLGWLGIKTPSFPPAHRLSLRGLMSFSRAIVAKGLLASSLCPELRDWSWAGSELTSPISHPSPVWNGSRFPAARTLTPSVPYVNQLMQRLPTVRTHQTHPHHKHTPSPPPHADLSVYSRLLWISTGESG